jgi:hypothetical protein
MKHVPKRRMANNGIYGVTSHSTLVNSFWSSPAQLHLDSEAHGTHWLISLFDILTAFKFKLSYDGRSVGRSVLVSGYHLGPATNYSVSSMEIILRYLRGILL